MEGTKCSLTHKGGTKEYFITLMANAQGKAIVIRRWGAKGAIGQVKVSKFDTVAAAERDYEKEIDRRQSGSKGYQITDQKIVNVDAPEKLSLIIGRTVFPKIGGSNVKHIDPNYDTGGMREPESNRDDDDNYVGDFQRRVKVDPDAVAAAEKAEREKELDVLRSNPKFGRF
ncbi:WGR domain-containing protein [Galbibacter sp. BG1]